MPFAFRIDSTRLARASLNFPQRPNISMRGSDYVIFNISVLGFRRRLSPGL
jgi:hypothetical protein